MKIVTYHSENFFLDEKRGKNDNENKSDNIIIIF